MEKAQVPTLFVAPPCLIPARMRYHAEEILVAAATSDGVLVAQTVKNPRQGMFNVMEDVALQGRAWRVEGMTDPTTGKSEPFTGTFPEHAYWTGDA